MRTINTVKNYAGDGKDPYLNDYQPLYIFEQPGYNSVFLKIVGYDGTYPAPLSESDSAGTENYNIGSMPTRWMYKGVVVTFSGVSNFNSFRHTTPFGSFVEDTSIPASIRTVQCINLIEMGNPPGQRGMICPGVVTATGNNLTAAKIWPDGVPGSPAITLTSNTKSSYPKGFAVQPICSGTIVEARRLTSPNGVVTYGPVYYFQVPNAHDGGCSSGIWPFFGATTESPFEPNTLARIGV
jgi:hypothetical protein